MIEAALAHVVRNRVDVAHARSDLFECRRVLMEDWARFLVRLVDLFHDSIEAAMAFKGQLGALAGSLSDRGLDAPLFQIVPQQHPPLSLDRHASSVPWRRAGSQPALAP